MLLLFGGGDCFEGVGTGCRPWRGERWRGSEKERRTGGKKKREDEDEEGRANPHNHGDEHSESCLVTEHCRDQSQGYTIQHSTTEPLGIIERKEQGRKMRTKMRKKKRLMGDKGGK